MEVGHFQTKFIGPFLAHVVPPLAAGISWRRLVAKVWTFENKKVHKHLHLWPLGPHGRGLAVTAGTSKVSTISQYGCSTLEAFATEAQQNEKVCNKFISINNITGIKHLRLSNILYHSTNALRDTQYTWHLSIPTGAETCSWYIGCKIIHGVPNTQFSLQYFSCYASAAIMERFITLLFLFTCKQLV